MTDGYHNCWRKLPIVIGYARGDPIIYHIFSIITSW